MIMLADQTPFFRLPLELRQLIYNAVLASPLQGPALLQTCREVYSEAHKFLFERPLDFRSQVAFFDWLDQVPHKYLPHVKELSLNIQDVDLRSLLKTSALISHPGDPPRLLTWDLYEAELSKLQHALRQLPGIRKLTIRAVAGRQSFLYREFLQKILVLSTSVYPGLLDIQLEGNFNHQNLGFLSSFTNLQAVSFDGFSASPPAEVAKIFSGLEHLTSLSLVSEGAILNPDSHTHSDFTTRSQSLTGQVVNTIDNLKYFSVMEISSNLAPPLFFTPEVLTSLHNHQNLKVLRVCLSQIPNDVTLAALGSFLENTQIKILELDWPQLHPHVLATFSLIPGSLEMIWVRVGSAADAFEMIRSLTESREAEDLCALSELVLLRSTKTYNTITPTVNDRKDSGTGEAKDYMQDVSSLGTKPLSPLMKEVDRIRRCSLKVMTRMLLTWCVHNHACRIWAYESHGARKDHEHRSTEVPFG
ncbi:hypothetical protein SVAN01_00485 [Stagonosporopsis vannaccii]|nr:hypothetical protein SVAN01_00485 [Stagonosporopsis vannaccii]